MSRISQHSQQTQRLPANVLPGIEDPNQVAMSGQPGQQRLGSSASGATDRVSLFKQPSFLTSPGFIPPGAPQTSNPSSEINYSLHNRSSSRGGREDILVITSREATSVNSNQQNEGPSEITHGANEVAISPRTNQNAPTPLRELINSYQGPRSIPPHLNRKSNYESEISVFDRQEISSTKIDLKTFKAKKPHPSATDSLKEEVEYIKTLLRTDTKLLEMFGRPSRKKYSVTKTIISSSSQKLLFNSPNPLSPVSGAQVSTESPIVTSSIIPSETIKPIMQVYNEPGPKPDIDYMYQSDAPAQNSVDSSVPVSLVSASGDHSDGYWDASGGYWVGSGGYWVGDRQIHEKDLNEYVKKYMLSKKIN